MERTWKLTVRRYGMEARKTRRFLFAGRARLAARARARARVAGDHMDAEVRVLVVGA